VPVPHQSPHPLTHTTPPRAISYITLLATSVSLHGYLTPCLLARSAIGMDTGSVTGGLAAGSHMRDELHVMRAHEAVS